MRASVSFLVVFTLSPTATGALDLAGPTVTRLPDTGATVRAVWWGTALVALGLALITWSRRPRRSDGSP